MVYAAQSLGPKKAYTLCLLLTIWFALLCVSSSYAVTPLEVLTGADQIYQSRLAELRSRYVLDEDPIFLERVSRIASGLIRQAMIEYPGVKDYAWEMHISGDPAESASCMAGGKLLVGRAYVDKLALTDAELAMLISHEIQHAALEHNYKEFQEALRLEPVRQLLSFQELEYAIDHDQSLIARLAEFNRAQEDQADRLGMYMAWHAGWSPIALAGFFRKLARADPMANSDHDDHVASARRWQMARKLAGELEVGSAP